MWDKFSNDPQDWVNECLFLTFSCFLFYFRIKIRINFILCIKDSNICLSCTNLQPPNKNCSLRTMAQSHFSDKSCLNFISKFNLCLILFFCSSPKFFHHITYFLHIHTHTCCIRCPKGFNSDTQKKMRKKWITNKSCF
jgi:hypothetical protein